MSVLSKYSNELRENKTINYKGLPLSPLKVKQYDAYRIGKDSFEIFQASLPPKVARLSWFSSLDALDREIEKTTGKTGIYFMSAIEVLREAMGTDSGSMLKIARGPGDNINAFCVRLSAGSSPVMLSMEDMKEIRQIIAAQNGYEIPDENWTIDLYRAQKKLQDVSESDLQWDLEALVYSVAVNAGVHAADVWNWSIKEFSQTQKAIDRKLGFIVCSLSENMGQIKYKKGNPYPTWKLNRNGDMPNGFKTLDELEGVAGEILNTPEMI